MPLFIIIGRRVVFRLCFRRRRRGFFFVPLFVFIILSDESAPGGNTRKFTVTKIPRAETGTAGVIGFTPAKPGRRGTKTVSPKSVFRSRRRSVFFSPRLLFLPGFRRARFAAARPSAMYQRHRRTITSSVRSGPVDAPVTLYKRFLPPITRVNSRHRSTAVIYKRVYI